MEYKKLYRSKKNKMIAGVAGGMAEYFNVDPALARLIWVVALLSGIGFPLYIIAWIIIPEEDNEEGVAETPEKNHAPETAINKSRKQSLIGIVVLIIGVLLIIREFVPWFSVRIFWPLVLIIIGLWLLLDRKGVK